MADFVKSESIVKVIGAQSVKAAIEINESNIDDLIEHVNEGIVNIVNDVTPQLGGDLDMNGHNIQTVTPTEMARIHGITDSIMTLLGNKQDADADTAKTDVANVWEKAQSYGVQALSIASGVLTWDLSLYPVATVTLSENITSIVLQNAAPGTGYELTLIQDGTGSRTVAFPASWMFPNKTAPVKTAAANSVDIISLSVIGTTETPIIRAVGAPNIGVVA